jgi:hypothetical protein
VRQSKMQNRLTIDRRRKHELAAALVIDLDQAA